MRASVHPVTILSTLPVRRVWRAAGAVCRGQRSDDHRGHRHCSANRHRQEERHLDCRFRAGRAARTGIVAARRDFPRLAPALSPDPDDHGRGVVRRLASDAWQRYRIGAAASAWRDYRRRAIVSQILTLFTMPVIYLGFDRLGRAARRRFGHLVNPDEALCDLARGLFRYLYQTSGRDNPADARARARRSWPHFSSCRSRRCRRSTIRQSWSTRRWPARARRRWRRASQRRSNGISGSLPMSPR